MTILHFKVKEFLCFAIISALSLQVDWDAPAAESRVDLANTTPTYSSHGNSSMAKDWGAMAAMEVSVSAGYSSDRRPPHEDSMPLDQWRESSM